MATTIGKFSGTRSKWTQPPETLTPVVPSLPPPEEYGVIYENPVDTYTPPPTSYVGTGLGYIPPSAKQLSQYIAENNIQPTMIGASLVDPRIIAAKQLGLMEIKPWETNFITQSVNPNLPGYVPPAWLPPPPSSAPITQDPKTGEFTTDVPQDTTAGSVSAQPTGNGVEPLPPPGGSAAGTVAPPAGDVTFVTQPGTMRTPDGGGIYYFEGDGTEFIGPDGLAYKWNDDAEQYLPMTFSPTFINSYQEFIALPKQIQRDILAGKPTGYVLNNAGVLVPYNNEFGIKPAAPGWVDYYLTGPTRAAFRGARLFDVDTNAPLERPPEQMSREEFNALPLSEQFRLLNSSEPGRVRYGVVARGGSQLAPITTPTGGLSNLFVLPPGQTYTEGFDFSYDPYYEGSPLDKADQRKILQHFGPGIGSMILETSPADRFEAARGAEIARQIAKPPPINISALSQSSQQGGGSTQVPVTSAEPTPPASSATPAPPAASAAPSPVSTPSGVDLANYPIDAPLPPGTSLSDVLNATFNVVTYGPEVYQNLPSLRLIRGDISPEEYATVSNTPTEVPGLGVTLPPPNALNYGVLNRIAASDPDAFQLLSSLFAASNRNLPTEMAIARSRAPLGTAFETTLIRT